MSTPIAIEVNCATGTVTERPLTQAEEIASVRLTLLPPLSRRLSGSQRRRPRRQPGPAPSRNSRRLG
jgi:hypothetical protein